jgi:hypothetical protein
LFGAVNKGLLFLSVLGVLAVRFLGREGFLKIIEQYAGLP